MINKIFIILMVLLMTGPAYASWFKAGGWQKSGGALVLEADIELTGDLVVTGNITSGTMTGTPISGSTGSFTDVDASGDLAVTGETQVGGAYSVFNNNQYNQNRWGILPLQTTWATSTWKTPKHASSTPAAATSYLQPIMIRDTDGTYYSFYEWNDTGTCATCWMIGYGYTTDPSGTWSTSDTTTGLGYGGGGEADEYGSADPTILYIPWAEHKWHMWFDMRENDKWRGIGHAYTNDLTSWTKQDLDSANGIDEVISSNDQDSNNAFYLNWRFSPNESVVTDEPFMWSSNYAHAPEAFLCGSTVHMIVQSVSDDSSWPGHDTYDATLYIASDSQGIGYEFRPWGPVSIDASTHLNTAERLQSILMHEGIAYAALRDTGGSDAMAFVNSTDCGRTWNTMGVSQRGDWKNYHAFFKEGTKIYGIPHADTLMDEIDLTNITEGQATVAQVTADCGYTDPYETATNQCGNNVLPIVHNVAQTGGYFIDSKPAITDDGIWIPSINTKVMDADEILSSIIYSYLEKLGFGYYANNAPTATLDGTVDGFIIDDSGGAADHLDPGADDDIIVEFRINTTDTEFSPVAKSNNSNSVGWSMYVSSGTFTWKFVDNDGGDSTACSFGSVAGTSFNDGEWHHVLATMINNGSRADCEIFVDGSLIIAVADTTEHDTDVASTQDFTIGYRGTTGTLGLPLDGQIKHGRVYIAADLSAIGATEALYNYRYPYGIHSNLVSDLDGEWLLEDGTGVATVYDNTTNESDLTVDGAPVWSRPIIRRRTAN